MQLVVYGFFSKDNAGDESYKAVYPILFPKHKFSFLDHLPDNLKTDGIILSGDVLYSDYAQDLKRFPKIPKYAFSVSVRDNEKLPPVAFKKIVSRDNKKTQWLPDFAFILTPNPQNGRKLIDSIFKDQKTHRYEKICVVVMNANLMTQEDSLSRDYVTFEKTAYELSQLADNTNASFLFLPFGNGYPANDRITNSAIYSRCKYWNKNAIVYEKYNPQQTLDIISASDLVISTRLHSTIFGVLGGTPFVDITHHDKNRMFLQTIGRTEWSIDYWHFNYHYAKNLTTEFLRNGNCYKQQLLGLSSEYKTILHQNAPALLP